MWYSFQMGLKDKQREPFFPVLLEEFVSPTFLEKVRIKFHFEEEQTAEIRKVAEDMLPVLRKDAFWVRAAYLTKMRQIDLPETHPREGRSENGQSAECLEPMYEKVGMSLGKGIDLLQEGYSERGKLLQSYIVEALSGELLMRGDDAYNRYVAEHTAWHVARYHFPGSEDSFPLEMLPELLKDLTQEITCNATFCMLPKKSVVFVSELTQDETVHCEGICVGCGNTACPNREKESDPIRNKLADMPLTYGYSRIFGTRM